MGTLQPFIADYIAWRRATGTYSDKSLRAVPSRLRSFADNFGRRPISHFTEAAVLRWVESLEGRSPNTKSSYLASVRAFGRWLHADGVLAADPCRNLPGLPRTRTVPRALSREAVGALLLACGDDRERAIILLMVGMGLRRMEVAGLRWEHYDERRREMVIQHAKNRRERLLPVPSEVALALARIRGVAHGPVIRSKLDDISPVSTEYIGEVATRIMWESGIKARPYDGVSGHALRHTFASDVIEADGDLHVLQQAMGHADPSTTTRYLHRRSVARLREAMEGRSYLPVDLAELPDAA